MSQRARGTVLIVEDDQDAAALLADVVEGEGFAAVLRNNASDALAAHEKLRPVAVLLDWGLPDSPGIEVCRTIRGRDPVVSILFVSGRDDETSIARGLDAGADDYIAKPIRAGELVARLESHLRRAAALRNGSSANGTAERRFQAGSLEVDLNAREVRKAGRAVAVGALEFKLLEYLIANVGTAVSRDQILNQVYGFDADVTSERVDLLVRRLRGKLGDIAPALIAAVPGYGYRLDHGD